jgi:hypothetical protein
LILAAFRGLSTTRRLRGCRHKTVDRQAVAV